MERIKALVEKLQQQLDQNNDISAMMLTVQLLQAELQHAAHYARPQLGSAKVAVVLPTYNSSTTKLSTVPPADMDKNEWKKEEEIIAEEKSPYAPAPAPVVKAEPIAAPEPVMEIKAAVPAKPAEEPINNKKEAQIEWVFDAIREIPTLAHQSDFQEINEMIARNGTASLNDRLRSDKTELAHAIVEAPVRDLRKAIGINDRYVFLNELFRGDETMYERSIKTINNFRILAEAQFWIERELKLKLGWDESKDIVRLFDQLVKRRFA